MKVSLDGIKVSIAGARLSHLVCKDAIWDHGTMIECVKTTFARVQKARKNCDPEYLKKYMSNCCHEIYKKEINALLLAKEKNYFINYEIKEVMVIDIKPGKKNKPDYFTALLKGYNINSTAAPIYNAGVKQFSVQWTFVHQGDWWLLDSMKIKKPFFTFWNY